MFSTVQNFNGVVVNEAPTTNRNVFVLPATLDQLEKGSSGQASKQSFFSRLFDKIGFKKFCWCCS